MSFDAGDVIALLALAISAGLAVIRVLEWRAKPRLRADMDWLAANGEPTRLNVVVSNRGRARGGVRALLLSPTAQHDSTTAFSHRSMLDRFPAMIEPGDLEVFTFEVKREDTAHTLTRALLDGTFSYLILIDQNEKPHPWLIPERPPESDTRRNSYGRVAKR